MWVNYSFRRIGGMSFLRVGSLQVSFCCTRKPSDRVYLDVQGAVACACIGYGLGALAAVLSVGVVL